MSNWEDCDREMDGVSRDLNRIQDATADMARRRKKGGEKPNERQIKEINKLIAQVRIRLNSLDLELREVQDRVPSVTWLTAPIEVAPSCY